MREGGWVVRYVFKLRLVGCKINFLGRVFGSYETCLRKGWLAVRVVCVKEGEWVINSRV